MSITRLSVWFGETEGGEVEVKQWLCLERVDWKKEDWKKILKTFIKNSSKAETEQLYLLNDCNTLILICDNKK